MTQEQIYNTINITDETMNGPNTNTNDKNYGPMNEPTPNNIDNS